MSFVFQVKFDVFSTIEVEFKMFSLIGDFIFEYCIGNLY